MRTWSWSWVVASALAVLVPSCGSPASAPYGLDAILLPEGSDDVLAVFAAMPETLQGLEANRPGEQEHTVTLSYGPERALSIVAQDWSSGEEDHTWTADELLPRLADSGEIDVDGSDLDGPFLWFTGENRVLDERGEVRETFWTMWFGAAGSGWVYAVNALSEADGVALVEAFVEGAAS